jgi:hypothetical protein
MVFKFVVGCVDEKDVCEFILRLFLNYLVLHYFTAKYSFSCVFQYSVYIGEIV